MNKLLTVLGAGLLAGSALAGVARADELTITSWGGAYQDSQREAYYKPYIAAGNKITELEPAEVQRWRLPPPRWKATG